MSDEEDEGITISKGYEELLMSCAEANDATCIQRKFGLHYAPAFVLTKTKGKRVEIGRLESGKSYKIPEGDRNQHIYCVNAALLSQAVYEEDPRTFLNSNMNHTIRNIIGITKFSAQKVMVAIGETVEENGTNGSKVLYLAYRGTASREDFMADIDIKLKQKRFMKFHSGFEERSNIISTKYILDCAEAYDCCKIVTCGHSMGGAVSTIVALDLMEAVDENEIQVLNKTFGSPFFGNKDVRNFCKENKFLKNIEHFVDYKDIVPGLLSLGHTASFLQCNEKKLAGLSSKCF